MNRESQPFLFSTVRRCFGIMSYIILVVISFITVIWTLVVGTFEYSLSSLSREV